MKDTIIKGSGNSMSIRSVPNLASLAPTYEDFLRLLSSDENGLPIDLGPLNPAGCDTVGDALNKANLLKDATAAMAGFGTEAVPDDILQALVLHAIGGSRFTVVTVLDADGDPIPGVTLSAVKTPDGKTPVTDDRGQALAVVSAATSVKFSAQYLDVQEVTATIPAQAADRIVSKFSVTLPFATVGSIRYVTTSGNFIVHKQHTADICCAGGGNAGTAGANGALSVQAAGGAGGLGGKILNVKSVTLEPGQVYEAIIADGGKTSGAVGGNTTFGHWSSFNGTANTLPMDDSALGTNIGGNGGAGGNGCWVNNTNNDFAAGNGGSSSRAGGGGGGGGGLGHTTVPGPGSGGASVSGFSGSAGLAGTLAGSKGGNGGAGGKGGYSGGGGGGGGGGGYRYGATGGSGGAPGAGGPGVVLVKFLD